MCAALLVVCLARWDRSPRRFLGTVRPLYSDATTVCTIERGVSIHSGTHCSYWQQQRFASSTEGATIDETTQKSDRFHFLQQFKHGDSTPLAKRGPGRILRLYSSYEFQVYNISDLPSSTMSKYRVKKKKKNAPFVKGSTRNHGTRVQNFSIYLQKKKA